MKLCYRLKPSIFASFNQGTVLQHCLENQTLHKLQFVRFFRSFAANNKVDVVNVNHPGIDNVLAHSYIIVTHEGL